MKKTLSFLLLLIMLLLLVVGCNDIPNENPHNNTTSSETAESHNKKNANQTSVGLTSAQKKEIKAFLNDPTNRNLISQGANPIEHPITVLGGEIDSQGCYTISYYYDGFFDYSTYLITLEKANNGYTLLSNQKIDEALLSSIHEKALAAYQKAPENERNIGEIQPETVAICRMDDGKYYQVSVTTTHDAIRVWVSQEELSMSADWDWILIGDSSSFSINNLGKMFMKLQNNREKELMKGIHMKYWVNHELSIENVEDEYIVFWEKHEKSLFSTKHHQGFPIILKSVLMTLNYSPL